MNVIFSFRWMTVGATIWSWPAAFWSSSQRCSLSRSILLATCFDLRLLLRNLSGIFPRAERSEQLGWAHHSSSFNRAQKRRRPSWAPPGQPTRRRSATEDNCRIRASPAGQLGLSTTGSLTRLCLLQSTKPTFKNIWNDTFLSSSSAASMREVRMDYWWNDVGVVVKKRSQWRKDYDGLMMAEVRIPNNLEKLKRILRCVCENGGTAKQSKANEHKVEKEEENEKVRRRRGRVQSCRSDKKSLSHVRISFGNKIKRMALTQTCRTQSDREREREDEPHHTHIYTRLDGWWGEASVVVGSTIGCVCVCVCVCLLCSLFFYFYCCIDKRHQTGLVGWLVGRMDWCGGVSVW